MMQLFSDRSNFVHVCLMRADETPAKKRKVDFQEKVLEVPENKENPLQCPVKFYQFYLSKWFVAFLFSYVLFTHFCYKKTCLHFFYFVAVNQP